MPRYPRVRRQQHPGFGWRLCSEQLLVPGYSPGLRLWCRKNGSGKAALPSTMPSMAAILLPSEGRRLHIPLQHQALRQQVPRERRNAEVKHEDRAFKLFASPPQSVTPQPLSASERPAQDKAEGDPDVSRHYQQIFILVSSQVCQFESLKADLSPSLSLPVPFYWFSLMNTQWSSKIFHDEYGYPHLNKERNLSEWFAFCSHTAQKLPIWIQSLPSKAPQAAFHGYSGAYRYRWVPQWDVKGSDSSHCLLSLCLGPTVHINSCNPISYISLLLYALIILLILNHQMKAVYVITMPFHREGNWGTKRPCLTQGHPDLSGSVGTRIQANLTTECLVETVPGVPGSIQSQMLFWLQLC